MAGLERTGCSGGSVFLLSADSTAEPVTPAPPRTGSEDDVPDTTAVPLAVPVPVAASVPVAVPVPVAAVVPFSAVAPEIGRAHV